MGSPAGLTALRDHIDKAIGTGESLIEESRIDFTGIRCKDAPRQFQDDTSQSELAGAGCCALAIAVLALAIYGAVMLLR